MVKERVYTVPLRKSWLKAPKWRRSKRAANYLKEFLSKHTDSEEVKLSRWINEIIWQHGGKNPPGKLKVKVTKEDEVWKADLAELPERAKRIIEQKKKMERKRKKKLERLKESVGPKKEEEEEEEDKEKAKITKEQEMKMNQ